MIIINKVVLLGNLTKDPELRYAPGTGTAVCRFTLAVQRAFKKDEADFINCVAFGKSGEFAEKYLKKGTKVAVVGRIQTGSYTNKDGQKVYTTDVVVEEQEFAESKNSGSSDNNQSAPANKNTDFMNIPDGIDEELPFN